ncbi:MAG: molybdopterin-dependent oxidoreductase [Candidatus Bathyarchaeia archaeon]
MRKRYAILLMLAIISSSLIGIRLLMNDNTDETLDSVEIRDYQGQKLSSMNDFRENSIKGPQHIDEENYRLVITGLVNRNMSYTYDDVIAEHKIYQKVVTLYCVEGWEVTILWEGVLVRDLVYKARVDPKADTVIFYAYDGYSTSLPLDYIVENNIMIAYRMNGVILPPERGFPFQLVAESKWGYKWIKWITRIELSDDANYRGFWESRGYSNDGGLDESFLEER